MSILISCENTSSPSKGILTQNINFGKMEPFQVNYYIRLTGDNDRDTVNNSFSYENDTLKVEVLGQVKDGSWLILETITPGSVSKGTGKYGKDTNIFFLYIIKDTLKIKKGTTSNLFSENTDLPLNDFQNNQVRQYGWKTTISWAYYSLDTTGYILNYQQSGKTYPRMNILVRNKVMQVDGPGRARIYSKDSGLVRVTEYGGYKSTTKGWGWDLFK